MVDMAPQRRRLSAGRGRWCVGLHRREHLPDEPFGRPADEADRAPGAADADEVVRDRLMVRREHHADTGEDGIELTVVARQGLGIRHDPLDVESLGLGEAMPLVEQFGCQVCCDDVGAGAGRGDRDVAGPRRDVVDALSCTDVGGIDEDRAERGDDLGRNGGVVAECPHRTVLGLEGCVVGGRGGGGWSRVAHGSPLRWWCLIHSR